MLIKNLTILRILKEKHEILTIQNNIFETMCGWLNLFAHFFSIMYFVTAYTYENFFVRGDKLLKK